MKSPYISRVKIKNFRNFKEVDVELNHKQVIVGENNIGKTNFVRALQLILDPTLSDEDRNLEESDFFNGLLNPMENKQEIEIKLYISNYISNKNLVAQFADASVKDGDEEKLVFTYKYFPVSKENGKSEYQYIIYKGINENKSFTYEDRKCLNIKVIKALRDVEGDMRNIKNSPIAKLIKKYAIEKKDLISIGENFGKVSSELLEIDELKDLSYNIDKKFTDILGIQKKMGINFSPVDIDPNKLLNSLNILIENRKVNETSLGLSNILYISLLLLLLKDNTVPSFLKKENYDKLKNKINSTILDTTYNMSEKGNYLKREGINPRTEAELYDFMNKHYFKFEGFSFLVIEEPEAHLHPIYQRLVYKDIIKNSENSVVLTTHSTHITSVTPLKSIVHFHKNKDLGTEITSTAKLDLTESEISDLERYIDVKRGEIYLGKGVILVEGIAEEYLVPKFADLLGKPLDERGIVVCNINSTNFKPYVKLLHKLNLPFSVITDGDFYYKKISSDGTEEREYHQMLEESDNRGYGYLGDEVVESIIEDLKLSDRAVPSETKKKPRFFGELGFFLWKYTLEVEIFINLNNNINDIEIVCNIFNELTNGGKRQKQNFKRELENGDYWKCLNKIEGNGIGKGRFSQVLSSKCNENFIPDYIKDAIDYISKKVDDL